MRTPFSLSKAAILLRAAFGSHFRRADADEDRGEEGEGREHHALSDNEGLGATDGMDVGGEEREAYSIVHCHFHFGSSCPEHLARALS